MSGNSGKKERSLDRVIKFPAIKRSKAGKSLSDISSGSETRYKGRQVTVSTGHPRNPRTGKYETGGPFSTVRVEPEINTRGVHIKVTDNFGITREYDGPVIIPIPNVGYSGRPASEFEKDTSYLDQIGADAISAVDPTNANANLGVALGEIVHDKRISLPAISAWKRRTEVAKAAGSEYLAAQFGWLPFVSDMKDTAQSVRDGNQIMKHYSDNSGTRVRREFEFEPIVSSSVEVLPEKAICSYSQTTSVGDFNGTPQPIIKESKTTVRRWFSGAFTYHNGNPDGIAKCLGVESEADKLFGLTLTPDIVWELTPWSWAIDWFSNVGSVISNVTSFTIGGLVMAYGYIMEETSTVDIYTMPATGLVGVSGPPAPIKVHTVHKNRAEANPFGFGLSWDGLSPTQLAISAALGITHLR